MRKTLSLLLAAMLIAAGSITAFAASGTVPSDVQGTKYEAAVKTLIEKEIVKGYADGSFKPNDPIVRAEVCTIIVNAMKPSEADLSAASNAFSDMAGFDWALNFVNYGASKDVVSGYGNGQFKPGNPVTYNEVATMLVKTLGYTDKDLTGGYPDGYVAKAKELGILNDVDMASKGETPAIRGDVALMTASIADQIPTSGGSTNGEDKPSDSNEENTDNGDAIFKNAGGAFGMINEVYSVTDKDGNKVDQIEFFMNGQTYKLNADKSDLISKLNFEDGALYFIKFDSSKLVKGVYENPAEANPKRYEVIAGTNTWADVSSRDKTVVTVTEAGASSSSDFNIMRDAVYYKATFNGGSIDGYERASLSDIETGAKVRAYDVTDDSSDIADIVVIISKDDVRRHM